MRHETIETLVTQAMPQGSYAEQWETTKLRETLRESVAVDFPVEDWAKEEGIADEEVRHRVTEAVDRLYAEKREKYTPDIMQQVEKAVLLQTLDQLWRDHIVTVDHLRQVVGLRGYGQRDPLNEYKTEAFTLFSAMITKLKEQTTSRVMRVEIQQRPTDDMLPDEDALPFMQAHHIDATTGIDDVGEGGPLFLAADEEVLVDPKKPETWVNAGRNDPCPCGSGKRYKHCHGKLA